MRPHVTSATYSVEEFTAQENEILLRFFTNTDKPVFALQNLPEVVKGALFARYSRTHKSLRRLFLDEFADQILVQPLDGVGFSLSSDRADQLYDRVFIEYGDDSVAQLGGAHLACEQASNLLTKVLEWGRLMAYLEQSTRYIDYQAKLGGRYRYYRPPEILNSAVGDIYNDKLDLLFDIYGDVLATMTAYYGSVVPREHSGSEAAYNRAVKAKALDVSRGILPAATLSNVGIYGTGQSYEMLLMRMKASDLPEVRTYAQMMLDELRKVIPAFLKRVDMPERGAKWSSYMADTYHGVGDVASALKIANEQEQYSRVELVDYDPEAEVKLVASILYPHTQSSESTLLEHVRRMTIEERMRVIEAFVGDRTNRRHKPGRALERSFYRFDVLSDYGAFRDLQRHRMLTIDWQPLSDAHGFDIPDDLRAAGVSLPFAQAMEISSDLYHLLVNNGFEQQAPYALGLAYRIRYNININARAAMHMIELRSTPQGHSSYRTVAQQMWRLIHDKANHKAIASMMKYVNLDGTEMLGRLQAEEQTEAKRTSNSST